MKSLAQFVKYNNWEKLDENIQAVTESNYATLVTAAVVYHSKECFDILMKHPNKIPWINKPRGHWRQRKIFENYYYGPNKLNEYYLQKVFELYEYSERENLKFLLTNKNIFHGAFNKIVKNPSSVKAVFNEICKSDDVEAFFLVDKYMRDNVQTYPFYNNTFVLNNLVSMSINYGSIEIIKKLHQLGFDLSKTKFKNQDVSSVVFALGCMDNDKAQIVFEFLYEEYPNQNQNLLWSNFIQWDWTDSCDYFVQLSFPWEPTVDFAKLADDYRDYHQDDPNEVFVQLTHDNLVLKIQTIINELVEDDALDEVQYHFSNLFSTLDYLIKLIPKYPQLEAQLKSMLNIPGIDMMKLICYYLGGTFSSIQYDKLRNSSRYYRRSRRFRTYRAKQNAEKLEQTFNIAKFLKANKLSEHNVLQVEYFSKYLVKTKQYLKVILAHLMKLGFVVTNEFKKEIVEKVFTKVELKSLDTTVKNLKSTGFIADIKGVVKPKKIRKSKTRKGKGKKPVPAMDDIDSDDEPILNEDIFQQEQVNANLELETDSESGSDSDSDVEHEIDV